MSGREKHVRKENFPSLTPSLCYSLCSRPPLLSLSPSFSVLSPSLWFSLLPPFLPVPLSFSLQYTYSLAFLVYSPSLNISPSLPPSLPRIMARADRKRTKARTAWRAFLCADTVRPVRMGAFSCGARPIDARSVTFGKFRGAFERPTPISRGAVQRTALRRAV